MNIPPLVCIHRNVRPYIQPLSILFWIYIRFIHKSDTNIDENCTNPSAVVLLDHNHEIMTRGCLDYLVLWIQMLNRYIDDFLGNTVNRYCIERFVNKGFVLFNDVLGFLLMKIVYRNFYCMYTFQVSEWKDEIIQAMFEFAKRHISFVKEELLKEERKMEKDLKISLWGERKEVTKTLPKSGRDPHTCLEYLTKRASCENRKWQDGLVSGTVYSGDAQHNALLDNVYSQYSLSNPLHADIWPSINQCEAEVISMTANLLNGNDTNVVGTTTSGGTESIIMAVRAHLKVYGEERGITHPEIICGTTAHAGLDKACEMFGIRLTKISCVDEEHFRLNSKKVETKISSNVIMIYSSAPCYPQGVIDPIQKLSTLANKYDIGLHVDACLGGFVLPFARMLAKETNHKDKYNIPPFDFDCPGVTSMSVDTHKYGYASKGTSVVLYRNKSLRRAQYFSYCKWTGGLYVTPTIAGSRPGALIACAWASLVTIGEDGFKSRVKSILDTTQIIANEISQISGLRLLGGTPQAMIVCFAAACDEIDIYSVADAMKSEGWSLNSLQNPVSIHLCVTLRTIQCKNKFIRDLKRVVATAMEEEKGDTASGTAAVYGMAGSMPAGPVDDLLKCYTDVTLSC